METNSQYNNLESTPGGVETFPSRVVPTGTSSKTIQPQIYGDIYAVAKESVSAAPTAVLITLIVVLGGFSWVVSNLLKSAKQELLPILIDYINANKNATEFNKLAAERLQDSLDDNHGEVKNQLLRIEGQLQVVQQEVREVKGLIA